MYIPFPALAFLFIFLITNLVYSFSPSTVTNIRQRLPVLNPSICSTLSARVPSNPLVRNAISVSSGSEIRNRCGLPHSAWIMVRIASTAASNDLNIKPAEAVFSGA
ncbi:MAG: hypothetical protein BWY89_01005 [Bacteroidetes bacterium ADurb.BinA012]|nr:MAG: hypothetical protein BWY89_01005 [Bacteroidetes bacterium ADurb.BinA012]